MIEWVEVYESGTIGTTTGIMTTRGRLRMTDELDEGFEWLVGAEVTYIELDEFS